MSVPSQDVEVRLAEIDRRLRAIQADLVPGRVPRETRTPAARPPTQDRRQPPPQTTLAEPPPTVRPTPSLHGRSGPLAEALAAARGRRPPLVDEPSREPPLPYRELDPFPELQASLFAAMRDLLNGYERAVSGAATRPSFEVTLSAGPFSGRDALRAFERALAGVPGVRDVTVRGYEGPDRAILEIELEQRTPPTRST